MEGEVSHLFFFLVVGRADSDGVGGGGSFLFV